jgi:Protein of unknown function (DUF1569)
MRTLARPRDTAEIVGRLKALRSENVRRWGRMSAHQMVCHLCDSSRMALGEKPVSPATGPLQRTLIKWIVLYAPVPWPPGVLTRPEIDQECGGRRPLDFAADVTELESLVEVMTTQASRMDGQVHPIFGRMSRGAWLRWAYLHMDHHLRQFGV